MESCGSRSPLQYWPVHLMIGIAFSTAKSPSRLAAERSSVDVRLQEILATMQQRHVLPGTLIKNCLGEL